MDKQLKTIAISNQKGGVGKTTTTINLGAALAGADKTVLIIDLDPQGNASTGLGIPPEDRKITAYDVLVDGHDILEAIWETDVANVHIVPSTVDLSSADIELMSNERRSFLLSRAIQDIRDADYYDYVLIDCPPSLNLLTINAMVAADTVLVPLQSEFFALEGLSQLMLTIREIRSTANKRLRIEGIVLTMFDRRNNLSQQVEADARENLGDLVFQTMIPRNVRVSEAPSFAMPVLQYDPSSTGAKAYKALAIEIINKNTLKGGAAHGSG
ncbi:MAG: AAA family ATPase [Pseudomonadota bacterium]